MNNLIIFSDIQHCFCWFCMEELHMEHSDNDVTMFICEHCRNNQEYMFKKDMPEIRYQVRHMNNARVFYISDIFVDWQADKVGFQYIVKKQICELQSIDDESASWRHLHSMPNIFVLEHTIPQIIYKIKNYLPFL